MTARRGPTPEEAREALGLATAALRKQGPRIAKFLHDAPTIAPEMPRGRPPKDGETLAERVLLRAGVDQKAAWQAAADMEGVDLSTWIRDRLDAAAERETRG